MRSTECPSSRFKTEDVDFILSFLFPFLLFILYVIVSCYILYFFLCVECAAAVLNRVCNIILEYRTRTCCQYVFQRFFCCAMLCKRDLCRHAVSVCPSVCLFVTFVYSVETNKDIFKMFSPSGSHNVSRRADCRNGDHCEIRICG